MTVKKARLACCKCRTGYPLSDSLYYCPDCLFPLEVEYDSSGTVPDLGDASHFNQDGIWRYRRMLPLKHPENETSLAEGSTPLIKSVHFSRELGIEKLFFKDETRNPTGSFKDRGSAVGVSMALELGMKAVGCVSTGNMAASLSAYASRAGLKSLVLISAGTPPAKVRPMLAYSANVFSLRLPYPEIFKIGFELSRKLGIYWVHSDAPMRLEGQKTSGYEVWQQLGNKVPDIVIIPTSSGGHLSAVWKSCKELHDLGYIKRLPAMVAVQASGCSPIVAAFENGRETVAPFPRVRTAAHAICNPDPPSGERVLRILRESRGTAVAVSDTQIRSARLTLAGREGILGELASAASVAALRTLQKRGFIKHGQTVVCYITGTGLKDLTARKYPGVYVESAATAGGLIKIAGKLLSQTK